MQPPQKNTRRIDSSFIFTINECTSVNVLIQLSHKNVTTRITYMDHVTPTPHTGWTRMFTQFKWILCKGSNLRFAAHITVVAARDHPQNRASMYINSYTEISHYVPWCEGSFHFIHWSNFNQFHRLNFTPFVTIKISKYHSIFTHWPNFQIISPSVWHK